MSSSKGKKARGRNTRQNYTYAYYIDNIIDNANKTVLDIEILDKEIETLKFQQKIIERKRKEHENNTTETK